MPFETLNCPPLFARVDGSTSSAAWDSRPTWQNPSGGGNNKHTRLTKRGGREKKVSLHLHSFFSYPPPLSFSIGLLFRLDGSCIPPLPRNPNCPPFFHTAQVSVCRLFPPSQVSAWIYYRLVEQHLRNVAICAHLLRVVEMSRHHRRGEVSDVALPEVALDLKRIRRRRRRRMVVVVVVMMMRLG